MFIESLAPPVTVHEYGDRYTLIGPLIQAYAVAEVEIEEVTNPYIKEILDEMTRQNVRWMYGRWLIEGSSIPRRFIIIGNGYSSISSPSSPSSPSSSSPSSVDLGFLKPKFVIPSVISSTSTKLLPRILGDPGADNDRRMKSVEESVQQLADNMLEFCQKSRRQRINQRNRTERLSDILDWKLMGMEYVRARNLALHRAYPDSFAGSELSDFQHYKTKIPKPLSAPGSPRIRGSNLVDVDDITDGITNFEAIGTTLQ
ncbi:13882_t:CDS:2 [Entrophospora sp. SA101]|nr:13882_t:CDS:2 [Entrophospora sp. SA101]